MLVIFSTGCNLPGHIPSSLPSSCSFLHLLLVDPISPPKTSSRISVFYFLVPRLPHTEGCMHYTREHRRRESDWLMNWINLLDTMGFADIYIFWQLRATSSFQVLTSMYGFLLSGILLGVTSSFRYLGSLYTIRPFYSVTPEAYHILWRRKIILWHRKIMVFKVVTSEYYVVYFVFVSRRCMMQPIISLFSVHCNQVLLDDLP